MKIKYSSTLIAFAFLFGFWVPELSAQVRPPLPTTNLKAMVSIEEGKPRIAIFEDAYNEFDQRSNTEKVYYFSPVLAISKVEKRQVGEKYKIFAVVQVNPDKVEELIMAGMQEQDGELYETIGEGNLQPLDASSLRIKLDEYVGGEIELSHREVRGLSIPHITVYTNEIDEAAADRLEKALKDTEFFPLYAEYQFKSAEVGTIRITITADLIAASDTYSNLVGEGKPALATRERISKISGEVVESVMASIRLDPVDPIDPADFERYLNVTLEMLQQAIVRNEDLVSEREKAADKILELGLEPDNFRPDLIRKSREILNEADQRKFAEYVEGVYQRDQDEFDLFTDFQNELTAKYKNDDTSTKDVKKIVEEVFSEHGIDISFDGKKLIPKSVAVIVSDKKDFDVTVLRDLVVQKMVRATETTYQQSVAPSSYQSLEDRQQTLIISIDRLEYEGASHSADAPYTVDLNFDVTVKPSIGKPTSVPDSKQFRVQKFETDPYAKKEMGEINKIWVFPLGIDPPPTAQIQIKITGRGEAHGIEAGLRYNGPSNISFLLDDPALFNGKSRTKTVEFSADYDARKTGIGFHLHYTVKIQKGKRSKK